MIKNEAKERIKSLNKSKVIKGKNVLIVVGIFLVFGVMVWQGIETSGVPNASDKSLSTGVAILSCGLLVFREGLEAILVLAAITATVSRSRKKDYRRGIIVGSGLGILSTIITWFIVVAVISSIDLPELDLQAATGLLAIAVLLLVMNWFFHKVYWTGWISNHTKRGRKLIRSENEINNIGLLRGFVLLGFTAIYREGFEIVMFLQQLRLEAGNTIVFAGVAVGLILTSIVAVLTFLVNEKLPYKKMLVLTGIMLGVVLLVMVGESIQEMQQAGWLPATPIGISFPDWIGMWFAVFPNIQGLLAQGIASLVVVGSYLSAQYLRRWKPSELETEK